MVFHPKRKRVRTLVQNTTSKSSRKMSGQSVRRPRFEQKTSKSSVLAMTQAIKILTTQILVASTQARRVQFRKGWKGYKNTVNGTELRLITHAGTASVLGQVMCLRYQHQILQRQAIHSPVHLCSAVLWLAHYGYRRPVPTSTILHRPFFAHITFSAIFFFLFPFLQ
jgi:hypothetical protein